MRRQLNVAKSMGGDVFVLMASINRCRWGSADDMEGRLEGCRLVRGGVPVCHGRIVLCFLSYLNRFVHGFCLNLEFEF